MKRILRKSEILRLTAAERRQSMNGQTEQTAKKEKSRLWKKILKTAAVILIVIAVLAAGLAAFLFGLFSHYYGKMNYVPLESTDEIIYTIPDETDFPETESAATTDSPVTSDVPVTDTGIIGGQDTSAAPGTSAAPETTAAPGTSAESPYVPPKSDILQFGSHIKNILLIGTDVASITARGRSDSMILVSINEKTGQIVMTSFMRDIYLHIPVIDKYNRINASYASGGVSLLTKTIEENFKIKIDRYVRINYRGFSNVVDYMGGIDVTLTQSEIDYLKLPSDTLPGVVHLSGSQTIEYCRCRKVSREGETGDFARTRRQRETMAILFEKLKGMSIAEIDGILEEFLPQVVTNIEKSEMLSMLSNAPTYLGYELKSYRIPVDGSWKYATVRKMSVLQVDFDKNIDALEKIINGNYDR